MRVLLTIWWSLTLFRPATSSAFKCPSDCHCLDESNWKVTCQWSTMPDVHSFSQVPMNKLSSLTIQCTSDQDSHYWPRMFASSTIGHLQLIGCVYAGEQPFSSAVDSLPSLRSLKLDNMSTALQLSPDFLTFSAQLDSLAVTSSGLEEVPQLCNLVHLKLLNLSSNRISHLDWLSFCDRSLVLLDVSNNRITSIHRDHLRTLTHLRILLAENNLLETISEDVFRDHAYIQELRLAGNRISSVASLPVRLLRLDLSNNWLSHVPSIFEKMMHLHHLNLSSNRLERFEFDSVKNSSATLRTIDIRDNRLSMAGLVGAGMADEHNFAKLQTLLLANNRLERLDLKGVRLPALRQLDLANNHQAYLGPAQMIHMPELRVLRLEDNLIGQVNEGTFIGSGLISELSLARNLLADVPLVLATLSNLTHLDLSGNRIAAIPKFLFDNVPGLSMLNLADNRIVSVDRYVFTNMPKLVTLNLANNNIEQLAVGCFDQVTNLKQLYLQGNAVIDLKGVLVNLVHLEYLNISTNRISSLDLGMLPSSLKMLTASHNQLTKVTNFLHQIRPESVLQQMDLSFNQIHQVTSDAVPSTLRALNLSHNHIDELQDKTFHAANRLVTIDLRYNKLSRVNESAFELKSALEVDQVSTDLFLQGNPIVCDCQSDWLKSKSRRSPFRLLNLIDWDQLTCNLGPRSAYRVPLSTVPRELFVCAYESLCGPGCLCCDFDSCDCKSVCPSHCTCQHDSSFILNRVRCTGVTVEPKNIPVLANEIHMDGTARTEVPRHAFLGRHRLERLYLNGSRIKRIEQKAFNGLPALLMLDLSHNELESMTGAEFYNVPKVTHLFLHRNRLTTLGPYVFSQMPNLKVITLHGNELRHLPAPIVLASFSLATVTLAQNPWKCDCGQELLLQNWLPGNKALVPDHASLYCQEDLSRADDNSSAVLRLLPPTDGESVVKVNFWTFVHELNQTFCRRKHDGHSVMGTNRHDEQPVSSVAPTGQFNMVLLAAIASALLLLVLVSVPLAWKLTKKLKKKRLYKKYIGVTNNSDLASDDNDSHLPYPPLLEYDMLICCNRDERKLVEQELLCRLEEHPPYYKVAMMYRDVLEDPMCMNRAQQRIAEDLVGAMKRSQRVITVLTDSFIRNEWNETPLRAAFNYLLRDKKRNLVLVIMGPLAPEMDPILAHYLRTNHCLQWTDPLFWQKFYDCMPERLTLLDSRNADQSSQYTDMYGTIVPSHFV